MPCTMVSRMKYLTQAVMVLAIVVSTIFVLPSQAAAGEPSRPAASKAFHSPAAKKENAPQVALDTSGTAATEEGTRFGIDSFARNNKGTARAYEGKDIGYRYPMASERAFAAVAFEDELLVYIPEELATFSDLNFSTDTAAQEQFMTLLMALDRINSNGGTTVEQLDLPVVFTSSDEVRHADCVVRFGLEVEQGYFYAVISPSPDAQLPPDISREASFVLTGILVEADSLPIQFAPEGWDAFMDFLTNMDYRPFWVSLRTSLTAMLFVFVLGLAAARLSLKVSERAKDVLDAIFTIPLVLPPTVIGFLLLVMFGNSTAVGRWLIDHGIELVFSWPAAVIAATVVAFPLMYRTVRGAFEAQDPDMLDAARTLGWGEARIFFKLMMPLAWPSIAAGMVLAFARAMGEFGATLFVAGNYAGKTQTMPIAIYFQWMGGNSAAATFWVFVVILISFVVILFINLYARHTQKFRLGTAQKDEDDQSKNPTRVKDKSKETGTSGEY